MWELESQLSSSELTEWMAYERMTGPLGRRRSDIQAAVIAQMVYEVNRSKKAKRSKLRDFIPDYGKQRRQKTPDEILGTLRSITKSFGGVENG